MSFIKELKRRNVFRVAIAYAIAAWLLIEISATTFPMLKLPEWTATFVTVLVLIGFPLALILAWAFELTPEGIKLEKNVDRGVSIRHITGRKLDFVIRVTGTCAISPRSKSCCSATRPAPSRSTTANWPPSSRCPSWSGS